MTESFVTQCPHCRTSFRVNHAQLGAAHGAVRCGACLHVFNAAQQLLAQRQNQPGAAHVAAPPAAKPSIAPQNPAPAAAKVPQPRPTIETPPGKNPSDTLWIHDDLDLDSLDLDEELAKLEQQEQQLSRQFLDLEQAPKYNEAFNRPPSIEPEPHDEQWAEALLHDSPSKAPLSIAPSEPQPKRTEPAAPVPAPKPARPAAPDLDSSAPTPPPAATSASPNNRHDEPEFDQDAEEPVAAPPEPPAGKAKKTPRSEPGLRDEHLFELDQEPLQLDWQQPNQKPWGRWLGWGLLNLIAAGVLAGQYAHYHFAELARQDSYRPWFEQLCPLIDCSLPSKVDINQVKSSNLVVRSHPEFSGALVVDAILYNRAPFAQPFPLLEIRFADINGRLLASRRFKPGEYLAGELAGQAEMPPQTPIHISLDILDPGTQAVNYSLSFHSPE